MSVHGDGESVSPPPFSVDDAFKKLINRQGKKNPPSEVPKFIKKLDDIPKIALSKEKPIKITLGELVGQFMGLCPSTKTTNDWI
jgi:hypothetical protein